MSMLDWIITNKEWVFSGIGVMVLSGLLHLARRSQNESEGSSNVARNVSGSNINQAGRDVVITHNSNAATLRRPRVDIDLHLEWKKSTPNGLSNDNSKEEATFVTKVRYNFTLVWQYKLRLKNNSSATAYSLEVRTENGAFYYLEKLQNMTMVTGDTAIELDAKYVEHFVGTGAQANEALQPNCPPNLKAIKLIVEYSSEDQERYMTEIDVRTIDLQ